MEFVYLMLGFIIGGALVAAYGFAKDNDRTNDALETLESMRKSMATTEARIVDMENNLHSLFVMTNRIDVLQERVLTNVAEIDQLIRNKKPRKRRTKLEIETGNPTQNL